MDFWSKGQRFEPRRQIFLTMVKIDILPYEFSYLSMVKNSWRHSKIIERGQKTKAERGRLVKEANFEAEKKLSNKKK